jgi:subtilisin family serine protease
VPSGGALRAAADRLAGGPTGAILAGLLLACSLAMAGANARTHAPVRNASGIEIVYANRASLERALERHPAHVLRVIAPLRVAEVRPSGSAQTFTASLRHEPGIFRVRRTVARVVASEPALELGVVSTPAGGAYEWQYYATGVDRVPASILGAAHGVTVAVLDTGADLRITAPDKVAATYDTRTRKRGVDDKSGHGTFVSSLVAGGTGVAGFGGAARLLVVKVADDMQFNDVDVAAGIVYAVKHGARIINLSVAGRSVSAVEEAAVRYAASRNVLLVAAAGNDALAGNPPEYPAALLQPVGSNGRGGLGLSVGASDFAGVRAPFSEFGSFVSLMAPGASVFGALPSNGGSGLFTQAALSMHGASVAFASGTSFAAPQVAGAAALVWAAAPALSAQGVASVLKQSATGGGVWQPDLGYGVLDVNRAVELARTLKGS